MSEAARADWLARAVNGLLRGHHLPEAPAGENQAELDSLLEAARGRLEMSLLAADLGRQYQGAVWQELQKRLQAAQAEDLDALQDVAELRGDVSDHASLIAETRREAVWQDVSERVAYKTPEKGISAFLRRLRRTGDESRAARSLQSSAAPGEIHRPTPQMSEGALATARTRSWAKTGAKAAAAERVAAGKSRVRTRRFTLRFVLATAGAALVVASLGPLPATGIADHPAARAIDSVGRLLVLDKTPPAAATP
jgi:hypothetical protein